MQARQRGPVSRLHVHLPRVRPVHLTGKLVHFKKHFYYKILLNFQVLVCNGVSDCIDKNDESQCGGRGMSESENQRQPARSEAVSWKNSLLKYFSLFCIFSTELNAIR